ncbi:6-phosphogluconolactonase [Parasphingopyxis marina]|uniref:6-phosphogluconolactonase n=1 Tax=Parasphingopyxis marina TaxID=2761622 RepID=A0A842HSN4_9SPHN|nr:6-phosphogluconolactonase [Parasphingopyxis marina]MBC2776032.1 6-phosphogluconolactonase [Parasphingopyxis marina]
MTASAHREIRHADLEESGTACARSIAAQLATAITARGTATLALSGGRTPVALFEALAKTAIDWSRVTVLQVDERWVAPESADSNQSAIRRHLLQGKAERARFLPMKTGDATPVEGQPAYEALLRTLDWPIDVTMLGIGEDGHTASLFPGAPELAEALTTEALCLAVTPKAAPHGRLSLSLRAIFDSRQIHVQLSGAAKEATYRRALGEGPVEAMPIRAILRQHRVPVELWITP